ncbi:MAG TPA: hypothetical protein VMG08_16840 [Allosphingosinicella sp.]|nr:hypothetical protein [Allosphingosinicella sp.]
MILSALLSAVTGAFAGTRPAEARLDQPAATQTMSVPAAQATVAVPALRPIQAIPEQAAEAVPAPAPAAPLPSAPIETDRLRE